GGRWTSLTPSPPAAQVEPLSRPHADCGGLSSCTQANRRQEQQCYSAGTAHDAAVGRTGRARTGQVDSWVANLRQAYFLGPAGGSRFQRSSFSDFHAKCVGKCPPKACSAESATKSITGSILRSCRAR